MIRINSNKKDSRTNIFNLNEKKIKKNETFVCKLKDDLSK